MNDNVLESQDRPARFLALGDSYTIGQSVSESDRWPEQLVRTLSADKLEFDAPTIIAQNGWTTRDLIDAIEETQPVGPFDLVSLLIGVNNQYDGLSEHDYVAELDLLLQISIELAGGNKNRVIVLSIPDWSVTPFAESRDRGVIRQQIDTFNGLKKQRVDLVQCPYVDVTDSSRLAANDLSLLAGDGLHPSAKMYASWCERVFPVVKKAFVE